MVRRSSPCRHGTTLVECAIVYPVVLLLLVGLVIAGLGVFRYQQTAWLAREGARWAAVRGFRFERDTGEPAATAEDVYEKVIEPNAISLDLDQLSYEVAWDPDNRMHSVVSVTVTYNWVPEAFLGGITLSSTSKMPVTY